MYVERQVVRRDLQQQMRYSITSSKPIQVTKMNIISSKQFHLNQIKRFRSQGDLIHGHSHQSSSILRLQTTKPDVARPLNSFYIHSVCE